MRGRWRGTVLAIRHPPCEPARLDVFQCVAVRHFLPVPERKVLRRGRASTTEGHGAVVHRPPVGSSLPCAAHRAVARSPTRLAQGRGDAQRRSAPRSPRRARAKRLALVGRHGGPCAGGGACSGCGRLHRRRTNHGDAAADQPARVDRAAWLVGVVDHGPTRTAGLGRHGEQGEHCCSTNPSRPSR